MNEAAIVSDLLLDKSPASRVMIDVGAHHGGTCQPFVEHGWTVYAFEPDPENRRHLINNLGSNTKLLVDHRAVTDSVTVEKPWFTSGESTGISGLSAFRESHTQSAMVDTVDLGSFCMENEISDIDFLKIDTEGHDLMVLKGFDWSNENLRPRFILCEFEDGKTVPLGYRWHEMADLLAEKGYQLIVSEWEPIVRYGIEHRWRCFHHYPCSLVDEGGWGNLIAIRDNNDSAVVADACNRAETQERARVISQARGICRKFMVRLRNICNRLTTSNP